MDIDKLKARKSQLEAERDAYVKTAQSQIDRFIGAIAVLDELIASEEAVKAIPLPDQLNASSM